MFESVLHSMRSRDTLSALVLTLSVLILLLTIGGLGLWIRLGRLRRRFDAISRGAEGNLEEILGAHVDIVHATAKRIEVVEQTIGVLQSQMPACLRFAHLIRYDAFDDVGGEQSFSLALLDARANGLVLTSVFSRSDVRVYAKSIQEGRASHALSRDEERLLQEATSR